MAKITVKEDSRTNVYDGVITEFKLLPEFIDATPFGDEHQRLARTGSGIVKLTMRYGNGPTDEI